MNGDPGASLRSFRFDAAPEGCPFCGFCEAEGQRAVVRPADPESVEDGVPFTVNLVGDREATRGVLGELRDHPDFHDLEVVNLTPYTMVVKATEVPPAERDAPSPLGAVRATFGDHVIVDPFVVDEDGAKVRGLLTEPATARDTLKGLQAIQEHGRWETFKVHGVNEFDPREHAGLLRRVLAPGQESLLRLAVDMGYYESPKKCTLEDIGERVGLSPSPVHKRLKRSEERLVNAYLDPGSVPPPETEGRTPGWIQDVARSDGPMVEILVRYRWEDAGLHRYMEAYPDARVVLHPFYDDPQREGVAFLAITVDGDAEAFARGATDVPHLREVELLREHDDQGVLRVETAEDPHRNQTTPQIEATRRLGRDAFLNPVYAEGGDVWMSVVAARRLTYEDVGETIGGVAEDVGWDDWDLVSIRPMTSRPAGGLGAEELTDRQREVLDIASALGYYQTPRRSTLEDIAETLGVSENAVHKNLTAAERKIVRTYLQGRV